MSVPLEGPRGRGGRLDVSLSPHGCPQHGSASQTPPLRSPLPAGKSVGVTCRGEGEVEYLDIFGQREEDEGSLSEWSEEDLSLHFPPSVILQSDEESEPESRDVAMETQVQKEEEPKRMKDVESLIDQVMIKDGPSEMGGGTDSRHRSCLRQNSMPASLHAHPTQRGEADSYRVSRGHVAGASKGPPLAGSWPRLQKSTSLDETKTKMASSLIMSILSRKMQGERRGDPAQTRRKKPEPPTGPAAPAERRAGLHLAGDAVLQHRSVQEEAEPHVAMVTASVGEPQSGGGATSMDTPTVHSNPPGLSQSQIAEVSLPASAPIQLLRPCFIYPPVVTSHPAQCWVNPVSRSLPWRIQPIVPAQVFGSLIPRPAARTKTLLDPETGGLVQVLLPAGPTPTVLPVLQFPPLMLYGTPCLPVTMTTSQVQTRDDVTPRAPW